MLEMRNIEQLRTWAVVSNSHETLEADRSSPILRSTSATKRFFSAKIRESSKCGPTENEKSISIKPEAKQKQVRKTYLVTKSTPTRIIRRS